MTDASTQKICPFRMDPSDLENPYCYCDEDCALFVPSNKMVGDGDRADGCLDGTCTFQNIAVQLKRSAHALEVLASRNLKCGPGNI